MAIFIQRKNITTVAGETGVMAQVVADMLANGFDQMYPSSAFNPVSDTTVILKASADVNPLTDQEWCIKFDWADGDTVDGICEAIVGTEGQFNLSTGEHSTFNVKYFPSQGTRPSVAQNGVEHLGIIGSNLNRTTETEMPFNLAYPVIHNDKKCKSFIYRAHRDKSEVITYPMTYTLSISDRGFVLMINEQNDTTGIQQSWICVQRPVDNTSGDTIITGHAPVHCIYATCSFHLENPQIQTNLYVPASTSAEAGIIPRSFNVRRFIVREDDIISPYPLPTYVKDAYGSGFDYADAGDLFGIPADQHWVDYNAVMNTRQQVSIAENNKYVITFPSGLSTSRFAYTHEADMIAYTSADVVATGAEITITVYGEATPRTYIAGPSSGHNNTGVRMLILKSEGGV
jgi:hypothetical protein